MAARSEAEAIIFMCLRSPAWKGGELHCCFFVMAVAAGFKVVKLWKRRHLREVIQSISVWGSLIDIIQLTMFAALLFVGSPWQYGIGPSLRLAFVLTLILIGTGIWVQGWGKRGLWASTMRAFRLERQEVGHFFHKIFASSIPSLIIKNLA